MSAPAIIGLCAVSLSALGMLVATLVRLGRILERLDTFDSRIAKLEGAELRAVQGGRKR